MPLVIYAQITVGMLSLACPSSRIFDIVKVPVNDLAYSPLLWRSSWILFLETDILADFTLLHKCKV
jgi:hypothetical protein